jgi:AsmA protein
MNKPLKFGLIAVVGLLILAIAAPFLLSANMFKGQVESAVGNATGRTFTIEGDITLKLLPRVVLHVEQASLSNFEGGKHPLMARMDKASIGVNAIALLSRNVEITQFVLEAPELNLEVSKNGTPNWIFSSGADEQSDENSETSTPSIDNVSLGDVRIVGGAVTYDNLQNGGTYSFSDVNMKLAMASLDSPFDARGSLVYEGEEVAIDFNLQELRALSTSQETPVSFTIKSSPIKFSVDGTFRGGAKKTMTGATSLNIPSLKRLNEWTKGALSKDSVSGALALNGDFSGGGGIYQFTNAKVEFDDMAASGKVNINLNGGRPKINGDMDVNAIDLRPYMSNGSTSDSNSAQVSSGWNQSTIDFTPLKAADVDLNLTTQSINVLDYDIGSSAMKLTVKNGVLNAALSKMELYEGLGTGSLKLDGSRGAPQITAQFELKGVDAEPLVEAALARKVVTGRGNFDFSIATSGSSQKQWMDRMSGSGKLFLNDGEIKGVDLARMAQIVSALTGTEATASEEEEINEEAGDGKTTEFVEMGGTFVIQNGVLNNQDFRLINDLLAMSGKGDINIGTQTIDFRVDPGANNEDGGLNVAMRIHGPWSNIRYSPDIQQILKQQIQDKLGIEEDSPAAGLLDLLLNK